MTRRSRESMVDRMSAWKRGMGPYSMILPEPCETRRVVETKAHR
jgi:hypothetical protein